MGFIFIFSGPFSQVTGPGGAFVRGSLPRSAYRQRTPNRTAGKGPGRGQVMGRGPPVPPSHLQPAFIGLLGGYEAHGVPGGHLLVGFPPHMVRTVDKIPCTFERGRLAGPIISTRNLDKNGPERV